MTRSPVRSEDARENESPTATVITSPSASKLMLDHPGWFVSGDGYAQRAFRSGETMWMLTCRRIDTSSRAVIEMVRHGNADAHPTADRFDATSIPTPVRQALLPAGYDTVHRFRNPDLWDALLIPILQHRRKNAEAASMYRSYCALYGEKVTTGLGTTLLPPAPEKATTLADNKAVMGLRMPAVRAAAWHYLQLQHDLAQLSPIELFKALTTIPGIGKASAARAIADTTGDFSFHGDAGFGSLKHWRRQQEAGALSTDIPPDLRRAYWQSLTPRQKLTLTALTTDRSLDINSKTEAAIADRNPRHVTSAAEWTTITFQSLSQGSDSTLWG